MKQFLVRDLMTVGVPTCKWDSPIVDIARFLLEKAMAAAETLLDKAPKNAFAPRVRFQGAVARFELKQYDKALANFEKANKLNPRHLQSLINMGVVYSADKNDMPSALKVSDRVAMLHQGRIAAVGTPDEIHRTHHSLIRDFMEGRL